MVSIITQNNLVFAANDRQELLEPAPVAQNETNLDVNELSITTFGPLFQTLQESRSAEDAAGIALLLYHIYKEFPINKGPQLLEELKKNIRFFEDSIFKEEGSDRITGIKDTKHLSILCVMDMGNGAGLVYKNSIKEVFIPMPVVGHWMKKGWGVYSKLTKVGKFPRLPGL